MPHRISRNELYELVWSQPISALSKRFEISDVALAKACARAHIPVPPRGWWARKTAGKPTPPQAPLNPRLPGQDNEVIIGGGAYAHFRQSLLPAEISAMPIPPEPVYEEDPEAVRSRVRRAVGKVVASGSLKQPPRAIADLLAKDEDRRRKAQATGYHWDRPKYDSPIERRRLRLLSALFSTLVRCECRVEGQVNDGQVFSVTVGHQYVSFEATFMEPRTRPSDPPVKAGHIRLAVGAGFRSSASPRAWEDGKVPLEDQLSEIAVEVIVRGEMQDRESVVRKREWLIERKAELQEKARQQQQEFERRARELKAELERARADRLLGEASALARAQEIRRYVEAVRMANANLETPVSAVEIEAWSTWALREADRIDPVASLAFAKPYNAGPDEAE